MTHLEYRTKTMLFVISLNLHSVVGLFLFCTLYNWLCDYYLHERDERSGMFYPSNWPVNQFIYYGGSILALLVNWCQLWVQWKYCKNYKTHDGWHVVFHAYANENPLKTVYAEIGYLQNSVNLRCRKTLFSLCHS